VVILKVVTPAVTQVDIQEVILNWEVTLALVTLALAIPVVDIRAVDIPVVDIRAVVIRAVVIPNKVDIQALILELDTHNTVVIPEVIKQTPLIVVIRYYSL
jgi:hypothetical protein